MRNFYTPYHKKILSESILSYIYIFYVLVYDTKSIMNMPLDSISELSFRKHLFTFIAAINFNYIQLY